MKNISTLFLKIFILLAAVGLLAGLIRFPQTEGRATNLDLISIYKDPLIIYIYLSSIPFFVATYHASKLLGYIESNRVFSGLAVKAVNIIKYCATITGVLIVLGMIYIRLNAAGNDPAGPTALGAITTLVSFVIAASAAIFQNIIQNAKTT